MELIITQAAGKGATGDHWVKVNDTELQAIRVHYPSITPTQALKSCMIAVVKELDAAKLAAELAKAKK